MEKSNKHKEIERFYGSEWTWNPRAGVGLHIIGIPSEHEVFLEVLEGFSCNRIAGMRILSDLMLHGERKVTVMFHIPFTMVFKSMKSIGLDVKIIEPANHSSENYFIASSNWDSDIEKIIKNNAEVSTFLVNKTPIERKIFLERLETARLSEALIFIGENC